jgi:hypothetical protein
MPRLLIHVEGETEEAFVNEVLRRHLLACGYESVGARIVGNSRQRDRRGGIKPWPAVKQDILRHLKQDGGCLATTMVDYYGLPQAAGRAWPGRAAASNLPFESKAQAVESALAQEISAAMGWSVHDNRFIPFVVMHEFEGLLFSDCTVFASAIGRPGLAASFQEIRDEFGTPEEINDSPITAPSKRIEKLVAGYQKVLFGNLAALEMGLAALRVECPHFGSWVTALEARCA